MKLPTIHYPLLLVLLFILFNNISVQAQQLITKVWEHTTGLPDTVDWSAQVQDATGNIYITGNTITGAELANVLTTVYGDELYVTGFFTNSFSYSGYLPLCNPGGSSFYDDAEEGDLNHGFINAFDVSMFEDIGTYAIAESPPLLVQVYPNPTSDLLFFQFYSTEEVSIEIFNMQGTRIFRMEDILTPFLPVDVAKLPVGTYLARVLVGTSLSVHLIEVL